MTHEQFQEIVHSISDSELIYATKMQISEMCKTGARSFTMTVPPRTNDTDIILSELVRRFEEKVISKPEQERYLVQGFEDHYGIFDCDKMVHVGSKIESINEAISICKWYNNLKESK